MKTTNFSAILASLFLLCAFFTFTSCEKEDITTNEQAVLQDNVQALKVDAGMTEYPALYVRGGGQLTFDFDVIRYECFSFGTGYEVKLDDPRQYAVMWAVDNRPAGHQLFLDCSCGTKATVYVTRFRDGLRAAKSVPLPPCNDRLDH